MSLVLSRFLQALRAADIPVSPAEGMDAAKVIARLGLYDRARLKRGLGLALAKTPDDKLRYGECFERFFRSEDFAELAVEPVPAPAEPAPEEMRVSPETHPAPGAGEECGRSLLGEMLERGDRGALQLALTEAAHTARVHEIRLFTQRGIYARRMLEAMGLAAVEAEISARRQAGDPTRADALQTKLASLREEVLAHVERQILLLTANAGTRVREEILREVPLSRTEYADFEIMQRLVRKLARRLAALHSRRRQETLRGQLDLRRTLRRNSGRDGLLVDLAWKHRRRERPRVIAVCDVSGSVATVARFLLLFLYSMTEVLPAVRAFVFSSELAEVTDLFARHPVDDAIATALKRHGGAPTDYGRALGMLREQIIDRLDHRSTLLILGDGRSNYGDPGHRDLALLHERAGRVLWLNPEPRMLWNTGDSEMRRLAAACDRVESCRSVRALERVIGELLRTRGRIS